MCSRYYAHMTSLESPELYQLESALNAAADLRQRADDLTDALVALATHTGALSQRQIADITRTPVGSINLRLARSRGERGKNAARNSSEGATAARESPRGVNAIQTALRDLLGSQKALLALRDDDTPALGGGTKIGWTDGELVWLHPATTRTLLNRHGGGHQWTSNALSKALAGAGVIRTRHIGDGSTRRSIPVRVGPQRHIVDTWVLRLDWLRPEDP